MPSAMATYHHRQTGKWNRAVMVLAAAVPLAVALAISSPEARMVCIVVGLSVAAAAWLFSSLTVEVSGDALKWHFGPGFWKKSIARADIAKAASVRTRWWYGWGIRRTPTGWLYTIEGLDAVEITERDGRTTLVGSDEPDRVVEALGFSPDGK